MSTELGFQAKLSYSRSSRWKRAT